MSHTQHQDYCLGCGAITIGHKTSGGMFYCNSCWKAAYQRQQRSQRYQKQSNTPVANQTFQTSNNGQYSPIKPAYVAEHFTAQSPKRLSSRQSVLLSQSPTTNDNHTLDPMHQISSLKTNNVQLRAQIDIILKNNEQLQQENRLLNSLGDGIEKYDYMQIKEENERLMEDAEKLSNNVKKVMFELKKMKQSNHEQQIEIEALRAQMEQERKMRMLAEETLTTKQEHWKFIKQQKEDEIFNLKERLRTEAAPHHTTAFDFKRPKSVQSAAQKFGNTVSHSNYKKRYNKKKTKNERGSNESKHSNRSNRSNHTQPKTPKKTRSFASGAKGRERRGSHGSVHSIESASSHHSLDVNVLPSKSILNAGVSKSALIAGGYRDLRRNTQKHRRQLLPPPMTHTQSVPHTVTVPTELTKKKSLPNNIGMAVPPTKPTKNEMSDDDTDIEDLYSNSLNSRDTTPTEMNAVNTIPQRTYKAQTRTNRKPNGKSHRTTYEVQRDRNTVKTDTFKEQNRSELDRLRKNSGGNVRDKRKKFGSNRLNGKYYKSARYAAEQMEAYTMHQ